MDNRSIDWYVSDSPEEVVTVCWRYTPNMTVKLQVLRLVWPRFVSSEKVVTGILGEQVILHGCMRPKMCCNGEFIWLQHRKLGEQFHKVS